MEELKNTYKSSFNDKKFLMSSFLAVLSLIISIIINFFAGMYATESASSPVTDIILSNIRAYDLDGIFVYGTFFLILCVVYLCLKRPNQLPFIVKSTSLFIIIRSIFITLTHIGPFPSQVIIHSDILSKLTFGADLFFSGHTGYPFLIALIFWKNKPIRNVFIVFSLTFAAVVLLAHMHYTIDVLAAFFITYTIFHISEYIFKRDRELFYSK